MTRNPQIFVHDPTESFMYRVLRRLEGRGTLSPHDTYLVVFAGTFDQEVFAALGYPNVRYTSMEKLEGIDVADASVLAVEDGAADHVIAHAGLHHASRPHQAVCEMYRAARRTAIFFEAQDSQLVRLAVRLGAIPAYEWNAIFDSGLRRGGVDDRPIPNYVYRWTRREVEKVVRSLDPAHEPRLEFVSEWDFSYKRVARRLQQSPLGILPPRVLERICDVSVAVANKLTSSQGNLFCALIDKVHRTQQRWIRREGTAFVFDPDAVRRPVPLT